LKKWGQLNDGDFFQQLGPIEKNTQFIKFTALQKVRPFLRTVSNGTSQLCTRKERIILKESIFFPGGLFLRR